MAESAAELVLHPIRWRLIRAFLGGRRLTVRELATLLPDVPQATLYRHLNRLVAGGVLAVVGGRKVRGATERRYGLLEGGAGIDPDTMSREEHLRAFASFLATLIDDFARYLQGDQFDLVADGVGYRQVPLYLSDEEFRQMAGAINAALLPSLANRPAPGRRRRMLTTIVMPTREPGDARHGDTETRREHGEERGQEST